jgi:hypothetical protein
MKKRPQIGFHRKHEKKEHKKEEKKDDPWGMGFSKDGWDFGPKSTPKFHVPDFVNPYKPLNEKKKKD